jgi:glyoxylase-like metal-dependent hydrolase (beta-lactamase superfamily II)
MSNKSNDATIRKLLLVSAFIAVALVAGGVGALQATPPTPLIRENATQKLSEHVYVIPDGNISGVPNVGIIVGSMAVLVVDTGLGPRNGETVLREVRKLSTGDIYIVGTHFHYEHILGESAFPSSARVIRARAEQKDIDEFGVQPNFATRSPAMAELVKEASIRKADEFFDTEKLLDLGGVRVRLTWAGGGTHTDGDTLIFVEGDGVLFAGDILMNRRFLAFGAPRSSVRSWIAVIEKAAPLKPTHIVPSHGDLGDGTLIASNLAYLRALQSRVAELKREGKTLQEAADAVSTEFRTTYAGWTGNAGTAARIAYDEAK